MASIYKRGKKLWVTWYNTTLNKNESMPTGLDDTPENRELAKQMASRQQAEMNRRTEEFKKLDLKIDSIKNAFNHHKQNNSNKHIKTIRDYDRFYRKFTETFNENSSCTIINKLAVENWLNELKKSHLQPNSVHAYGKQLYHFLNFLFEYNYIPMFKINRNVKTRPEVKEKIIFSREDLDKIFKSIKDKSSSFKAMINLCFFTGLRSSDILSLQVDKIGLESRVLSYYSPKRKKFRKIAFHEALVRPLKEVIDKRTSGRLLAYSEIEAMGRAFTRFLDDIGLSGKGYTLRTFRKTFQTLAVLYDMKAVIIDELVGYEQSKVSAKYYIRISLEQEREELKKFRRPKKGDIY